MPFWWRFEEVQKLPEKTERARNESFAQGVLKSPLQDGRENKSIPKTWGTLQLTFEVLSEQCKQHDKYLSHGWWGLLPVPFAAHSLAPLLSFSPTSHISPGGLPSHSLCIERRWAAHLLNQKAASPWSHHMLGESELGLLTEPWLSECQAPQETPDSKHHPVGPTK